MKAKAPISLPLTLGVPSRMVACQLTLMMIPVALLTLVQGAHTGVSFLMGVLCGWLPNTIFVRMVFSTFLTPGSFVAIFTAAAFTRMLLSATLLVILVQCLSVDLLSALAGIFSAAIALTVSSLLCMDKKT